jgi:hypothetical protein
MNTISNARDLISTLGRDAVAQTVGVGLKTVSAAYVKNKLPAAWYLAIKEAAADKKIEPTDACFSFRQPSE